MCQVAKAAKDASEKYEVRGKGEYPEGGVQMSEEQ